MRLMIAALAVILVLLVGASAYLLLQSCGVRLPVLGTVLSVCETAEEAKLQDELAAADRDNRDLLLRIGALERDLAQLQCKADPPPPPPPPPPKPKPKPKPKTPSGLDPDAFDRNDISVMKGCWQLSSNYSTVNIRTRKVTHYNYWRICFDQNGNGTEEMRATNGVRCKGSLQGRMPGNGTLKIREPGNLQCDNGAMIFRRDIDCRLDNAGRAHCDVRQPSKGTHDRATLRRVGR